MYLSLDLIYTFDTDLDELPWNNLHDKKMFWSRKRLLCTKLYVEKLKNVILDVYIGNSSLPAFKSRKSIKKTNPLPCILGENVTIWNRTQSGIATQDLRLRRSAINSY